MIIIGRTALFRPSWPLYANLSYLTFNLFFCHVFCRWAICFWVFFLFWLYILPLHTLYRNPKSAEVQLQDQVSESKEAVQELFNISAAQTCNGLGNRMVICILCRPWGTGLSNHRGYCSYPTAWVKSSTTNSLLFLQIALQIRFIYSFVLQDPPADLRSWKTGLLEEKVWVSLDMYYQKDVTVRSAESGTKRT